LAFSTIIDTATLSGHTSDPTWRTIDCRFKLDDEGWGLKEYHSAHIPGAAYAHLGVDLSGLTTGRNGRHPLPDPSTLSGTLGRLGVSRGVQVVAYDQDSGMYASRLWWLLRWMGHDEVAVLDGGFAKWLAEARPTTGGEEPARPREFDGTPQMHMIADVNEVAGLVGRPDSVLLDARAPERYRGDVEPIDRVPGRIPGAVNHHFLRNLDERGTFRPAASLRHDFEQVLGQTPADRVVCYCGSGVTACQNLVALEYAGLKGARLYAGSWSEWASDPSRPVERSGST
jgi:thiosulfate/3-mercaptopyruvate sulfurtransferase